MEKKEQYNSTVSVMRALAALFVISQHVPYEGSLQFVYYFMCTAVPFFFLVAGYFSWNMDEKARGKKIVKHLKKMVLVYVSAYLFYYMISVGLKYAVNAIFHTNIAVSFEKWNLLELIKGILLDIDPFASHLWFLYSMIFIYAILWLFHFEQMKIPAFIISLVLFGLAHTSFGDGETLATIRVAVTSSFSTAYIGYFVHHLEDKYKEKNIGKNLLGIIMVAMMAVYLLLKYNFKDVFIYNSYTEYVAFVMFLFAIKYKNIGRGTFLEKIGAKYTLGIYIFHIFVMHMWERVKGKLTIIPQNLWNEMDIFIVYGLTLLLYMFLIFAVYEIKRSVKKVRVDS